MRHPLSSTLDRLLGGEHLGEREAGDLLRALTDDSLPPALAGALLAALRAKGETADEVRGFARGMRELALRPQIPAAVYVDTVGTGGDGSGSLNLSTGTGLLSAACDIAVVKHGNRSISSRCGSADVLEALGLALPLDEAAAGRCLERCGFSFLFAPYYHPAMKALAGVRAALGVRTLFDLLGPLTNPARPPYQLIGAFSLEAAELMARTLAGLEIERAFVVHGEPGWDEATPVGAFVLFDVRPGEVRRETREPADYGLQRCAPGALAGGDAAHNAARLLGVLEGREHGPHRDALLLGTALVLELLGRETGPRLAIGIAEQVLASGRGAAVVESLRAFSRSEAER